MKSIVLLALVGFVAAIPLDRSTITYTPNLSSYGYQGNSFDVAEYVAYQFHQAQKVGYSPSEVAAYLLKRGYPEYVAQYLAAQYEAGLSKPYFQSPYEIFRYFYQQGISDDVAQYIIRQIGQGYQQYSNGQQVYGQEYSNVPVPFSQYLIQQRNYYNQYENIFSGARYANGFLQLAEQYALEALQFLSQGEYQQSKFQYIYQQLEQGLGLIRNAQAVYKTYQSYQGKYVPYYAAQYYAQQTAFVYKYFEQAYQYVKGEQWEFPQDFVQQVLLAYEATQKAFQAYKSSFFSDFNQYVIDEPSTQTYGYTPYSSSYYNYGPYSSSYLYGNYGPYKQNYGYSGRYSYGIYGPSSSSYQYGSYVPYGSSIYNYGSYGPYTQSYGYQYGPYKQGLYGQYNKGSTYTWPYYYSSYLYKPYSEGYGYKNSIDTPYQYGSYVPSVYRNWKGVGQSYGYGYPSQYGYSNTYSQIAAIAA